MTRNVLRARGRSRRSDADVSPSAGPVGRRPGDAPGPVLRTVGLSRVYGEDENRVWAVDGVDLDVPAGQTLAVTGPSGCGKSTLLQLLGGLDRPSDGEVWLGGRRIDCLGERALARLRRRAVGFVFQDFHLMDELTAAENVELPALLAGASPRTARRCAAGLLDRVGLADRARHLPSELSGGQRQRVAIARALVNEPLVVLADEPTGNLDSAATHDVLRLFGELRAAGQTLVVVTHDERVAATADRVVSLRDGTPADDTRLNDSGSHSDTAHLDSSGGHGGTTRLGALLNWGD
ncbi:ABC transporter ATP-binding protein [Streptomyces sp. NPDC050263]|uniref:ABC transporter ATP-binding protein n=1 Tax=Streptomyces sp. NPDC050263 TaxID=3155037 RepID=UPI0034286158